MRVAPRTDTLLYLHIANSLAERIRRGQLAEGDRLPSERELALSFGVSRMTARQAIRHLVGNGLVACHVGKGCFVSRPKIDQRLRMLSSFTEEMARLGMTAASVVLRAAELPATRPVALALRLAEGEPVACLERVRLADGAPVALECSWVAAARCPGLIDGRDFARVSLYGVLRRDYGVQLARAEQEVEAGLPDLRTQQALGVGPTAPVLALTRTTFDLDGRPVEFVRSTYRGDRYKLRAELTPAMETTA